VSSIWRPVRERNPARSLMVVVAHPGDEAFGFGGAIAQAAASGAYTVPEADHLAKPRHRARG